MKLSPNAVFQLHNGIPEDNILFVSYTNGNICEVISPFRKRPPSAIMIGNIPKERIRIMIELREKIILGIMLFIYERFAMLPAYVAYAIGDDMDDHIIGIVYADALDANSDVFCIIIVYAECDMHELK